MKRYLRLLMVGLLAASLVVGFSLVFSQAPTAHAQQCAGAEVKFGDGTMSCFESEVGSETLSNVVQICNHFAASFTSLSWLETSPGEGTDVIFGDQCDTFGAAENGDLTWSSGGTTF